MPTDRDHLLAAVAANPDDDLPRLVFADWLDDHGGGEVDSARAAFIRAQVAEWRDPEPWELSKLPRPSAAIEATHREAWLSALSAKQRAWVEFERGFAKSLFLHKVRTGFLPLLEKPAGELATVLRLAIPALTSMREADYPRIAASPGLSRLRELAMADDVPGATAATLLGSPHLTRLEDFRCYCVRSDLGAILAAHTAVPLRRLSLAQYGCTAREARNRVELADVERAPLLRDLTDLDFSHNGNITRDALAALFQQANLPRLERLSLGTAVTRRPACRPEHLRRAVEGADLASLRSLTIDCDRYGSADAAAAALAGNARMSGLEGVWLLRRPLSLAAFARLVESSALAGLKRLDVEVRGKPERLYDYLLASDAPLRLEKLCVGKGWPASAYAERLTAKYGAKLQ